MKKIWTLIILFVVILGGIGSYFLFFNKGGQKEVLYDVHLKVNPLVTFKSKVVEDKHIVVSYTLVNDKAREIFSGVDFNNMELILAIELYGDKVKESKIEFTNIYLWTSIVDKDYFKSDKYNINYNLIDENFGDVFDKTKNELKYNTKYYLIDDEHGYNMMFKEDGVIEYHVDKAYTEEICDEFDDSYCFDYTFDDKYYSNVSKLHQYRIDGNYVIIEAKDGEFYNGWHMSYDKCEIMFNRLKCDNYNAYHSNTPKYQYTVYYEVH